MKIGELSAGPQGYIKIVTQQGGDMAGGDMAGRRQRRIEEHLRIASPARTCR